MMKIIPGFKRNISYLDLASLERSGDVIYIVDPKLHLVAYNDMWETFALSNDGEEIIKRYPLGADIRDAFQGPIRNYFFQAYTKALKENTPFEQTYECSSPQEYRLYHQTAYPLVAGHGLVISNHLVKKLQHDQEAVVFNKQFVDVRGLITQCQNCRKVRDPQHPDRWYWVPSLVKDCLDNVSHGICPRCMDHYFPDLD